jgi:hypothetical protein
MATDKARFLVSRTYGIVTPESASNGEESEGGFVFEREPMSLEDTVKELRECSTLSSWPVRSPRNLSGYEWASTEPSVDYQSGNETTESVHVKTLWGSDLDPRDLYRLFQLAGLIGKPIATR